MVKGTLDWDQIDLEVCDAVRRFLIASKTPNHQFVNSRLLTKYIAGNPHRNLHPHLLGGWYHILTRCTTSMRRMGWKKWSGHVYLVPLDENGNLKMIGEVHGTIKEGAKV